MNWKTEGVDATTIKAATIAITLALCIIYGTQTTVNRPGCERINGGELRDECYRNYAGQLNDPGICAHITDNITEIGCCMNVGYARPSAANCKQASDPLCADECNLGAAIGLNDTSACASIVSESLRAECTEQTG